MELQTEIAIAAPASDVWKHLTAPTAYHAWNPFVTSLAGSLQEGSNVTVVLSPPDGNDIRYRARVLNVHPEQSLTLRGSLFSPSLLRGEHRFSLKERDGGTRMVQSMLVEGFLEKYVKHQLTRCARGMVFMNQALKKLCEQN